MTDSIRAAGGLVVDKGKTGKPKILLVHRPAYDDWSLPKGKIDAGETAEVAAVREVLEETGYHCRIAAPLGMTHHTLRGVTKEVTWYAMRPLPDSPGFVENREVDRVSWLSPRKARETLAYANERELLDATDLAWILGTGTIRLARHGDAGDRRKWSGPDVDRPLTAKGRGQATRMADLVSGAGIDRIVSSPYLRCIETMHPVAERTGAPVEVDQRLTDETSVQDALELLNAMIGHNAVL
jgi:8-oxo-dGTP diphosphatase